LIPIGERVMQGEDTLQMKRKQRLCGGDRISLFRRAVADSVALSGYLRLGTLGQDFRKKPEDEARLNDNLRGRNDNICVGRKRGLSSLRRELPSIGHAV
jgi:hypothetical protein